MALAIKQRKVFVARNNVARPGKEVANLLPWWMTRGPKLQILLAVVIAYSVFMVNGFIPKKFAAYLFFHDDSVHSRFASAAADANHVIPVWVDGSAPVCSLWFNKRISEPAVFLQSKPVGLAGSQGSSVACSYAPVDRARSEYLTSMTFHVFVGFVPVSLASAVSSLGGVFAVNAYPRTPAALNSFAVFGVPAFLASAGNSTGPSLRCVKSRDWEIFSTSRAFSGQRAVHDKKITHVAS